MHPRNFGQGGCGAHPDQPGGSPAGGRVTAIRTTCAYCGVGCGVSATPSAERAAIITGDAEHPTNRGRLCSKGTHLGETVGLEGRFLYSAFGGRRVSWGRANGRVAKRFADSIARHGPDRFSSEERRVGSRCVWTGRFRWTADP